MCAAPLSQSGKESHCCILRHEEMQFRGGQLGELILLMYHCGKERKKHMLCCVVRLSVMTPAATETRPHLTQQEVSSLQRGNGPGQSREKNHAAHVE